MNSEALERYKESIEIMEHYNPDSLQLVVAKSFDEAGFSFMADEIIKLTGITIQQFRRHRAALFDGYGYVFDRIKTDTPRVYNYKLVDVTLQKSDKYILRMGQKRKEYTPTSFRKVPQTLATSLINEVFQ